MEFLLTQKDFTKAGYSVFHSLVAILLVIKDHWMNYYSLALL
jgi:hypothetical protein